MRRTKEDAQLTRATIMDAARAEFMKHGVSHTTLEQIARAAGVTRGAIYWHFSNKSELLAAMRHAITLPLLDVASAPSVKVSMINPNLADQGRLPSPLQQIEDRLMDMMHSVTHHTATREMFTIMSFKCEYVGELETQLQSRHQCMQELVKALQQDYQLAQDQGNLRTSLQPRLLALETAIFIVGLVKLWLLDEPGTLLRQDLNALIHHHILAKTKP